MSYLKTMALGADLEAVADAEIARVAGDITESLSLTSEQLRKTRRQVLGLEMQIDALEADQKAVREELTRRHIP